MPTIQEVLQRKEECRHIVNISGGKDSAAMAIYLAQKYPEIPAEYLFCDTGTELPETYEYLERLEALLGKKIQKVDVFDVLRIPKKGRVPFDFILKEMYSGFLPSPRARWCTRELKIKPFEHFVGKDKAFSYIGIRGDEDREGYKSKKPPTFSDRPNIEAVYPFKDDGITLEGVKRILDESGIGLPKYYSWRSRSGCFFCFYQQIGEWQGLKSNHPDLFEKAKEYEKGEEGNQYTWVDGKSLEAIGQIQKKYPLVSPDETESCAICHL